MHKEIKLKIADTVYKICLSQDSKLQLPWLEKECNVFYALKENPDLEVLLKLDKSWQRKGESFNSPLPVWRDGFFSAQTRFFDIEINLRTKQAIVYSEQNLGMFLLMRFLTSLMIAFNNGFFLHASSVFDGELSYVFFGPSGSGKTTVTRLSKGKAILTDETTAIAKRGNAYYAYATPFAGEFGPVKANSKGPIKALFLLKKSQVFKHRKLTPNQATIELFCNSIRPHDDLKISNFLLDSVEQLVRNVPCYELYFRPEEEIWRYIYEFVK